MAIFIFLLIIGFSTLEYLFVRGFYKSIMAEWERIKQRNERELKGRYDNSLLEYCNESVLNYIIVSVIASFVFFIVMVLLNTYFQSWLFIFYVLFPIIICFVYRDFKKYHKPRKLCEKWLTIDSVCAIVFAIMIHYGLFHIFVGVVNKNFEIGSYEITVPITSISVSEGHEKGGDVFYTYEANFEPIKPKSYPKTDENEPVGMPISLVFDALPYLSGDKFFTMHDMENQEFSYVYTHKPFEADSVRLNFVEGYYGFLYKKEFSLIGK